MAILMDRTRTKLVEEEYKPESSIINDSPVPAYKASLKSAGPKKLTIAEYLNRQVKNIEAKATLIPEYKKPKHRRGGKLTKLRRKLATYKRMVQSNPPPDWNIATSIWTKIIALEEQLQNLKKIKKQN